MRGTPSWIEGQCGSSGYIRHLHPIEHNHLHCVRSYIRHIQPTEHNHLHCVRGYIRHYKHSRHSLRITVHVSMWIDLQGRPEIGAGSFLKMLKRKVFPSIKALMLYYILCYINFYVILYIILHIICVIVQYHLYFTVFYSFLIKRRVLNSVANT